MSDGDQCKETAANKQQYDHTDRCGLPQIDHDLIFVSQALSNLKEKDLSKRGDMNVLSRYKQEWRNMLFIVDLARALLREGV